MFRVHRRFAPVAVVAAFSVTVVLVWALTGRSVPGVATASGQSAPRGRATTATLARRDFVRAVRLSGTVEAIQSTTISTPRMSGPNSNSLVITRLVRAGSSVQPGDLIVEF